MMLDIMSDGVPRHISEVSALITRRGGKLPIGWADMLQRGLIRNRRVPSGGFTLTAAGAMVAATLDTEQRDEN